ncbi:ribosomal protein S18 acetylase RimI-like enzyme [Chitinophaga niastensis]|uniref:Ribosomal protein S18 acetylase RimI-like enzyme n=1 Tax=Chitinophaga niastensis TaxID=536980 RepID=A0A2P8HDB2_CHINA|nr:GNAT family N-acetyltransferase [Chitinophaga niastensis]PSL44223.1 ribosomal protein S18 acetylase RimI-like enzyme [Chitinophaga niastensis]
MEILNSTMNDIDRIFDLYDDAVAFQKTRFNKHWQSFDQEMVATEIKEGRQWKIVEDGATACIFASAFSDPFIWGEKNTDPAIYLHRIVTNPLFRGKNYVLTIIEWAKVYGKKMNKDYIRIDTWGDNQYLIDYYVKCGFTFLGLMTPEDAATLPSHYSGISLSLFEIKI